MPQADDGRRTMDKFRFHELCRHSQAELKNSICFKYADLVMRLLLVYLEFTMRYVAYVPSSSLKKHGSLFPSDLSVACFLFVFLGVIGVDKKHPGCERTDPLLRWIHFLLKKRTRSPSTPDSAVLVSKDKTY